MLKRSLKIDPEDPPYNVYEGYDLKKGWTRLRRRKIDELEHALVRGFLPISGRRIIDVGCGFGRLADCYLDRFQQVIMFDAVMSFLHQAIEKTRGQAIYVAGDVMHLPFRSASFDTELMIRVFHHIPDERSCLSELHRILCDDGKFIFSYRNKCNAMRIIRWLVGRSADNPFTTQPSGERYPSCTISHHPKAVHSMLLEAGFVDIRYYGAGVFGWLAEGLGFMGRWIPPGRTFSRLLGISKIAPWILCSATAKGKSSQIDARGIADLLQCPSCGGAVSEDGHGYLCLMCRKHFPIEDEIIDMRL